METEISSAAQPTTQLFSFICLESTIGRNSSANSTDLNGIGGYDECLGVSPGPGMTPSDPQALQSKRRQNMVGKGEAGKARWDISYAPDGIVKLTIVPNMCMARHSFKTFDVYLQYTCSGPLAAFNTTMFLDTPDRTAVLLHRDTGMCVTAMKCNRKRICTGPAGQKTCAFYCDKATYKVAAPGEIVPGAYFKLWPCYFSRNGNPLDKHAQVFRNRLDCAPGCTPLMQGDGVCQIPCANDLCNLDDSDCTSAAPTVPTLSPTTGPSSFPTLSPTFAPSLNPTIEPSESPTSDPTTAPSGSPTVSPTRRPTPLPTVGPSLNPTTEPTESPSFSPSSSPTFSPSRAPTLRPSHSPTANSTIPAVIAPVSDGLALWLIIVIAILCLLCCLFSLWLWLAFYRRERKRKDKKDREEPTKPTEFLPPSDEEDQAPTPPPKVTVLGEPVVINLKPKDEPKEEPKRSPPPLPQPPPKRPASEFKINQQAEAVRREVIDVHVASGQQPADFLKRPAIERKTSRSQALDAVKRDPPRLRPVGAPPPKPLPTPEDVRAEKEDEHALL